MFAASHTDCALVPETLMLSDAKRVPLLELEESINDPKIESLIF